MGAQAHTRRARTTTRAALVGMLSLHGDSWYRATMYYGLRRGRRNGFAGQPLGEGLLRLLQRVWRVVTHELRRYPASRRGWRH